MKTQGSTISRRASVNWIMLIYFISGACSLIDEVVWVRLIKLTLGNTIYATSIVVSVFMGGLALGAIVMGRYSDRIQSRLRLYALLEILVTVSALSLPWMLKVADRVYVWFYRSYHPSHAQLMVLQIVISAALLLLPSMLMGSTLPLLGRFVTSLEKECGHLVGRLYALNTLGAACGCFLAGFVLIRTFGVMGTLYTAAAMNLLVASGGWFLSRFSIVSDKREERLATVRPARVSAVKNSDGGFYVLVAAFFLSGLISIGYELLWMRSIIHLLGGFTYVFSAVLTVYLVGNVIGAGIGSRLARRLKKPALGFAVSLSVLGFCGVFYLPLLILWTSKVAPYLNRESLSLYRLFRSSYYTVNPLLQSMFLFLVPSIVMGIGFPIALQAWANHKHKIGQSTGTAYGANTIGAVFGGIITGFVLIPLLGVQVSIFILGLVGMWFASVMWLLFSPAPKTASKLSLAGCAMAATIVILAVPSNLFHTVVRLNPMIPNCELVDVKEGTTTTVSLHRDAWEGSLQLLSSGQIIAGDNYAERGDQKMLGHLGILLNSGSRKVLSVGFGSGETTCCLAQHELDRIDCVEIAPEVVEVSLKNFMHLNLGEKLDEEVNMIFMDAKNYIHLTDTTYDVIINDSIHPREFAENASLYTREYFESAREHLNKNGIIMSWLPIYGMPASVFGSIIVTLMEVFPHVTIWYPSSRPAPLVLIIGSEERQYYSPEHIQREMLKPGVRESLALIDIHDSTDVLACYVADDQDMRRIMGNFSINSDHYPLVEFSTDLKAPQSQILRYFILRARSESLYDHINWTGLSQEQKDKTLKRYRLIYEATDHLFKAKVSQTKLSKLKHIMNGLAVMPDRPALLDERTRAENLLYTEGVSMINAGDKYQALELAGKVLMVYPESASAWMIRVNVNLDRGNLPKALTAARRAVKAAPANPETHFNLGFVLYSMGHFDKAIEEYKQMWHLAKKKGRLSSLRRAQMLDAFATVYAAADEIENAISTAEEALRFARASGQRELVKHLKGQLAKLQDQRTAPQQY